MLTAGENVQSSTTTKLSSPLGLFVDDDQTVVIADYLNHRIVQWRKNDTNGQTVAGGNGPGNQLNQLKGPTDVLIDKELDDLVICDSRNRRIIKWSRRRGTSDGTVYIRNIRCYGLAMDDERNLYVSDFAGHGVQRYKVNEKRNTRVAGFKGRGTGLHQLDTPTMIFVDRQQTVYISDSNNHRIMKWPKNASKGMVVTSEQHNGNYFAQFYWPTGLTVDMSGTLYVADSQRHHIMRYSQSKNQTDIIIGVNSAESTGDQLHCPIGLSLDRHGNLYVVDHGNNLVQLYSIH